MITKTRVALLLSILLILSGFMVNQTKENIVLQIAASENVQIDTKINGQSTYKQVSETKEETISETKINQVVYREAIDSNGISWLAAKVQDAKDARQETKVIHTYNQFDEKISTITVPNSKKITGAQPTIYQYGAQMQPGAVYNPRRVTRYGYDCGGCSVNSDYFANTAGGIKVGFDRVKQSNGEWKSGFTYDGYHLVATSNAVPLFSILKISDHPFSGGGIIADQPFYAIVGDRGVSGSSIDLFAGTETNLNAINQRGNPSTSNTKVEVVRVGR